MLVEVWWCLCFGLLCLRDVYEFFLLVIGIVLVWIVVIRFVVVWDLYVCICCVVGVLCGFGVVWFGLMMRCGVLLGVCCCGLCVRLLLLC